MTVAEIKNILEVRCAKCGNTQLFNRNEERKRLHLKLGLCKCGFDVYRMVKIKNMVVV